MRPQRPFQHVPRRVLNVAVIAGGVAGIVLQSRFGWSVLTTFLITLGLCAACVGIAAIIFGRR